MGICCLKQNYMFLRNNIYRNKTVQLARSAILRENVVIHEHCVVGDGTELSNSVIGRGCKIGQNCVIENVYIFDNVTVGNKCQLRNCVIGKGSTVSKDSVISRGAVIGNDCLIPNKSRIEKQFVVSAEKDGFEGLLIELAIFYTSTDTYFINSEFQALT